jgi:hypothetical protein
MDGCAPGTSRQETTAPPASDTTASHVARAFRSRSTRNARRSIASPSRKASTTSLGGSWSATLTKTTSSPSARARRTIATAASISAGVRGSSGWITVRVIVSMIASVWAVSPTVGPGWRGVKGREGIAGGGLTSARFGRC